MASSNKALGVVTLFLLLLVVAPTCSAFDWEKFWHDYNRPVGTYPQYWCFRPCFNRCLFETFGNTFVCTGRCGLECSVLKKKKSDNFRARRLLGFEGTTMGPLWEKSGQSTVGLTKEQSEFRTVQGK
ncbi:hypothetical protein MRB53_024888 [Persea americana]|uniref:Uncharacterized protein n=1 Tax=Persea americana TaxID=3435 RepID=A0ACC2LE73_PERAE|nr:hypothetical protein MRB53_024888 [Persea americana]